MNIKSLMGRQPEVKSFIQRVNEDLQERVRNEAQMWYACRKNLLVCPIHACQLSLAHWSEVICQMCEQLKDAREAANGN